MNRRAVGILVYRSSSRYLGADALAGFKERESV